MIACNWSLSGLENGIWSAVTGPTINPTAPTAFVIDKLPGELAIVCSGPAFAGALAKFSAPLPWASRLISFKYRVKLDDTIAFAQVLETDTKFTDGAGWTYDGSFQFNVAEGWMTQINNPWVDTGVKLPLAVDVWNDVQIDYALDYNAHTIAIAAVNGKPLNMAPLPAKQVGWGVNSIVTQLQLCTNAQGGAYIAKFMGIGYSGSDSA